ncbi:hypothetical protein PQQ52_32700 [Paraburkholderia sediminicola]|uniref:hypothetical protein n=1 Tax=Paraburkholderia sediminicola TaxID=458836 RepID=UPI0038BCA454
MRFWNQGPLSSWLHRARAAQASPERTKPIIAEKNAFGLLYAGGPDCSRAKGLPLVLEVVLEAFFEVVFDAAFEAT